MIEHRQAHELPDRVELKDWRSGRRVTWAVVLYRGTDFWIMGTFKVHRDAHACARTISARYGVKLWFETAKVIDFPAARATREVRQ